MKERPKDRQNKDPKRTERQPNRPNEGWNQGASENAERRRGTDRGAVEPAKRAPDDDLE